MDFVSLAKNCYFPFHCILRFLRETNKILFTAEAASVAQKLLQTKHARIPFAYFRSSDGGGAVKAISWIHLIPCFWWKQRKMGNK